MRRVQTDVIIGLYYRDATIYVASVYLTIEIRDYEIKMHNSEQVRSFLELTGGIVSAYVAKNALPVAELPVLINRVHAALHGLAGGAPEARADVVEKPSTAQIRKSVRDDGIVSFIDGKSYKTLKRHLTGHGLDPKSYRERYGLPADYPMTAPSYAAQRSALAKSIGLGRPGAMAENAAKGRRKAARS